MLIKKRFSNKKVKTLAGIMTACLIIGGALFTLPVQKAKGDDSTYPPSDSSYEKVWWDEFNDTSLNRENGIITSAAGTPVKFKTAIKIHPRTLMLVVAA